ncbi:MAG: CHAT domain-containing protein [Blastocatellia bacterium]|nr:CHAT domain-containing protein [Blastocatellia bacterium]
MLATKIWYIKTKKETAMVALAKAAGKIRTTEARLSGEFAYAPYVAPIPSAKTKVNHALEELKKELLAQEKDSSNSNNKNSIRRNNTLSISPRSATRGESNAASDKLYETSIFIDPVLSNLYFSELTPFIPATLSLTRSAESSDQVSRARANETKAFRNLAAEIMLDDIVVPTLETAHAKALIYILRNEFNLAIERLEQALKEIPAAKTNAELLNDLAVAYLARAHDEEQPIDIFEALLVIDSAVTADPNLLVAQYNQALILQKLYLSISVGKYWDKYLRKEKSEEWKAEINKYIDELNQPTLTALWEKEKPKVSSAVLRGDYTTVKQIVSEYPHFARMYALEELFPSWATSYLERDFDNGEEVLRVIQAIGKVLIEIHQDHMIDDGLATIYRVYDQPNSAKALSQLAQAHLLYNEGYKLNENNDPAKASKPLAEALAIFKQYDDSAFTALIYFYQARSYFFSLENKNAFETLEKTKLLSEKYNYPYLLGRTCSINSQEQRKLFQFSKALEIMPLAIKLLKQTSALSDLSIALINYSQLLTELGQSKQVLDQYYKALQSINKLESTIQNTISIGTPAIYLTQTNRVKIVFYFYDELFEIAMKNKLEKNLFSMLRWRSLAYHKQGKDAAALKDIEQTKTYLSQFTDKTFRLSAENELAAAEGEYSLEVNPQKSIQLFTKIIDTYIKAKSQQEKLSYLYLLRSRAYLVLNDYKNAESDLKASIQEFEIARKNIKQEVFRTNFFEKPQEVYDEMIQLQLKLNHPDIAFNYLENKQARVLLDLLHNKSRQVELLNEPQLIIDSIAKPFNLEEASSFSRKIPSHTALISYAFLSKDLYIWSITKDKINVIKSPLTEEEINSLIEEFYKLIEQNKSKELFKPLLIKLYQGVLQPVLPFISPEQTLVFIPSKSLYQIPFSALFDNKNNQYLIEKYKVIVSPSATIFTKCLERNKLLTKQNRANNLLAIGNPSFNRKIFPNLSNLPASETEAKQISQFYKNPKLLLDKEATKSKFLALAENYNIIHFAGHAIMDEQSPLYSQLVFAEDETKKQNNGLYAYELYKQKFNQTKLVVLAACKTANGRNLNNEGIANLARPFLAAGVPTVIASLWNANDRASSELFTKFHQHLIKKGDSVEALQKAQLELINHSDPSFHSPQFWAAFVLLGGN